MRSIYIYDISSLRVNYSPPPLKILCLDVHILQLFEIVVGYFTLVG